jgi:hypothetical protein
MMIWRGGSAATNRLKCNVSSPLFIVLFLYHIYITALSHYHGLPTFIATAIEYMLSGLLREHQNNYPLVSLPHLEHTIFRGRIYGITRLDSRADWSLISVVLQVGWANKQYSSHDPAWVRHVSELGQVDTCEVIRSAHQPWHVFKNIPIRHTLPRSKVQTATRYRYRYRTPDERTLGVRNSIERT